jgi:hypothetical protein
MLPYVLTKSIIQIKLTQPNLLTHVHRRLYRLVEYEVHTILSRIFVAGEVVLRSLASLFRLDRFPIGVRS